MTMNAEMIELYILYLYIFHSIPTATHIESTYHKYISSLLFSTSLRFSAECPRLLKLSTAQTPSPRKASRGRNSNVRLTRITDRKA